MIVKFNNNSNWLCIMSKNNINIRGYLLKIQGYSTSITNKNTIYKMHSSRNFNLRQIDINKK